MANNPIMNAKDALTGSLGECFVTIDGNRYNFMSVINVSATVEKTKTEVAILGKTGKGNKSTGWSGSGSATIHYNTRIFRDLITRFKETGEDVYFDMQITNDDPTSGAGRQTVILIDCNMDSVVLAMLDADSDTLQEDFDFTFEDFKIPENFTNLPGMI